MTMFAHSPAHRRRYMPGNEAARRAAYDVMHAAFLRLREVHTGKSADEIVDMITQPPNVSGAVWRQVRGCYIEYARRLRSPLALASVSPARDTDLDTAQIAAIINQHLRSKHRLAVLLALNKAADTGATDYELGETLKLLRTSAGKRRKELVDIHCVEQTTERRPTDTDSPAVVWRITRYGRKIALQIEKTAERISAL